MKKLLVLLAYFFILTAQAQDGNKLLQQCTAALDVKVSDPLYAGYCFGYIEGVRMAISVYSPKVFCLPSGGITNGQAVRVVKKYLEDNPAKLHLDSFVLTVISFREAYPCK